MNRQRDCDIPTKTEGDRGPALPSSGSLRRKYFSEVDAAVPWAGTDRTVVLVTGYFDVFHAGHVRFLESCADLSELLVVGVHSDELARRDKGPGRPRNCLEHRLMVVAALECVDYVFEASVHYDEDDFAVLRRIDPDVIVLSCGKPETSKKQALRLELQKIGGRIGKFRIEYVQVAEPVVNADELVGPGNK